MQEESGVPALALHAAHAAAGEQAREYSAPTPPVDHHNNPAPAQHEDDGAGVGLSQERVRARGLPARGLEEDVEEEGDEEGDEDGEEEEGEEGDELSEDIVAALGTPWQQR